jgi:hypothetical protein
MRNQIPSRQSLKYRVVIGISARFFAVTDSALAEGLSDEDYLYLATVQHIDHDHTAAILNISPVERARLHYLDQ